MPLYRRPEREGPAQWQGEGNNGRASGVRWLAIAASFLIIASAATFIYTRFTGVTTGIGEQRTVVLDDGSRIILNTDTRIIERYDGHQRRVELRNGEALFEVAPESNRPFIVTTGGRTITPSAPPSTSAATTNNSPSPSSRQTRRQQRKHPSTIDGRGTGP